MAAGNIDADASQRLLLRLAVGATLRNKHRCYHCAMRAFLEKGKA
jgi:hypothetical protein